LRGSRELVWRCTLTEKTLIKFWLVRLFIRQTHCMISIKVSWQSSSSPERRALHSSSQCVQAAQYSTHRTNMLTLSEVKLTCALLKRGATPSWPNRQSSTITSCSKEAQEGECKMIHYRSQAVHMSDALNVTCPLLLQASPPVQRAHTIQNNTFNALDIKQVCKEVHLLMLSAKDHRPHVGLDG